MWLPTALNEAALCARGQTAFYCAYGHRQYYIKGESEETKLRRERDRLAQQIAQRDDEIKRQREMRVAAERQAAAARGQVTKMKRRAQGGVCPCCNRTFAGLARHMNAKHPEFAAIDAGNVVPLKRVGKNNV